MSGHGRREADNQIQNFGLKWLSSPGYCTAIYSYWRFRPQDLTCFTLHEPPHVKFNIGHVASLNIRAGKPS